MDELPMLAQIKHALFRSHEWPDNMIHNLLHSTGASFICNIHNNIAHSFTHLALHVWSVRHCWWDLNKTWGEGTSPQISSVFIITLVGTRGVGHTHTHTTIPCQNEMTGRIRYWLAMRGTVSFPTNFIQNKFHHYTNTRAYFNIVSCLVHYIHHRSSATRITPLSFITPSRNTVYLTLIRP